MKGTRDPYMNCLYFIYASKDYATVEIHARKYIVRLTHFFGVQSSWILGSRAQITWW